MKDNSKFTYETIAIDPSRRVSENEASTRVLLYDKRLKCYYETTIESIISCVMDRAMSEISSFKEATTKEIEEFEGKVSKEQSDFISDTTKNIDALINLVEGGDSK